MFLGNISGRQVCSDSHEAAGETKTQKGLFLPSHLPVSFIFSVFTLALSLYTIWVEVVGVPKTPP